MPHVPELSKVYQLVLKLQDRVEQLEKAAIKQMTKKKKGT